MTVDSEKQKKANMAAKAVRHMRKLEKPRPLKQHQSLQLQLTENSKREPLTVEEVLHELESLYISINNGNYDKTTAISIRRVCDQLKEKGHEMEMPYREQFDRYFVGLRNASREERLEAVSRMRLLEIIELRAMRWKTNENLTDYYRKKFEELEAPEVSTPINPLSVSYFPGQLTSLMSHSGSSLAAGEVLKPSGKFAKPTKIPGKNYYKDEIVIRNSDSGKVMGIKGRRVHMIEELSDTIISFQRVSPGARDRLVQITGQSEDSINCSKILIEDTIRRNASPVRDKSHIVDDDCTGSSTSLNSNASEESTGARTATANNTRKALVHSYSMSDASLGEHIYTVTVGRDTIKLSGNNADTLKTAKLVLEEYFAGQAEVMERQNTQQMMTQAYLDSTISNYVPATVFANLRNQQMSMLHPKSVKQRDTTQVSSSSEEETYKESGSPTDDEKCNGKEITDLPMDPPSEEPKLAARKRSVVDLRSIITGLKKGSNDGDKVVQSNSVAHYSYSQKQEDGYRSPQDGAQKTKFLYRMDSRINYSREFILDCAKSPFSHLAPNNLNEIAQIAPITKEVSVYFDPDSYKEYTLPVMFTRSTRQGSVEKSEESV